MAIPWDTMDEEYLKEPKVWSAQSLVKFMIWLGPTSSVFDIITFAVAMSLFGFNSTDAESVRSFNACWFLESLATQTLIVHMVRTKKIPFFQSRAHPIVWTATIFCVGLSILLNQVPDISRALAMEPVPGLYFVYLFICLTCYAVLVQIVKAIYVRVYNGQWLD
jgi:P-type Mg2+ transporter